MAENKETKKEDKVAPPKVVGLPAEQPKKGEVVETVAEHGLKITTRY